jgi:hypothetical protein
LLGVLLIRLIDLDIAYLLVIITWGFACCLGLFIWVLLIACDYFLGICLLLGVIA